MANSADPVQLASSAVCKGTLYQGSAGLGLTLKKKNQKTKTKKKQQQKNIFILNIGTPCLLTMFVLKVEQVHFFYLLMCLKTSG